MAKVQVQQGWLSGEKLETVTGDRSYYSFKGIPYAEPPIGKLRFKAPKPPLPWDGVRDAKEHGPKSPQVDIFTQMVIMEGEDCLYLNVYTPDLKPGNPLPVMFFIHGGGFKSGSGNVDLYGPDFLVSHDVVLVTINYRLDALGFLCLDIPEVPGNAAMKDQVAALKWVRDNIAIFGGDPNNVTIFGESAGGSSVSLHVMSPMSKGLFKRAIPMSGVPLCDWSIPFLPQRRAFMLGNLLGFHTTDPEKLLEFLQSIPYEKLVNTNPTLFSYEEVNNTLIKLYHFTPVIEKDFGQEHFLTKEPLEILKSGRINDVDVLIGYTDKEILIGIEALENSLIHTYNRYLDMLVPRKIIQKCSPEMLLEISDRINDFYFKRQNITVELMKEFLTYCDFVSLVHDILRFASHLPKAGDQRRYLYKFSCVSQRNVNSTKGQKYGIEGTAHMDDLMYLFDAKSYNLKIDKSSKEYALIELACKIFTNFAKYGNPTPDNTLGLTWPEYDNINKAYVEIKDTLVPGTDPEAAHMEFWKSIYDYAGLEF